MIDIGYDDRNAFSGLKTLTFVLFLFFTRVVLSLAVSFIIVCMGVDNKVMLKIHSFLVKGLFFNQIIRIGMEAYYEFFLIGYMNYKTAEFTYNGEVLGVLETIFVLTMILVILPILSIFITFKTKDQLENKNLKQYIGVLYESTKTDNKL